MNTVNVASYKPSSDEEYMNPIQLAYFRNKLLTWRETILAEARAFKKSLKETDIYTPDPVDQGTAQTEVARECFDLARQQSYLKKIDRALELIMEGEYGYCEVTGEEIGIKRLEVQPIATMSVEAQEAIEKFGHCNSYNNQNSATIFAD